MVFGYLILISTDFLRFYFSFFCSVLVSTEKIYQTLRTLFDHISKHCEVCQKHLPRHASYFHLSVGGNVVKLNTIFRVWYIELQLQQARANCQVLTCFCIFFYFFYLCLSPSENLIAGVASRSGRTDKSQGSESSVVIGLFFRFCFRLRLQFSLDRKRQSQAESVFFPTSSVGFSLGHIVPRF